MPARFLNIKGKLLTNANHQYLVFKMEKVSEEIIANIYLRFRNGTFSPLTVRQGANIFLTEIVKNQNKELLLSPDD